MAHLPIIRNCMCKLSL